MSNSYEKEVEEANREFLQAIDKLEQLELVGRAKRFVLGEKLVFEQLNEEYFKELREAEAKVAETDRKLEEAIRRWRSER